jgi:hypothetical protein
MADLTEGQLATAYQAGQKEARGYLAADTDLIVFAIHPHGGNTPSTREEALAALKVDTQERLDGAIQRKDDYHIQVFKGMLGVFEEEGI